MKLRILKCFTTTLVVAIVGCGPDLPQEVAQEYAALPEEIDYNFHIKPILSDRCYSCHGPDELAREGGFRLDIEKQAKSRLESGLIAIAEGKPGRSELCNRILSDDGTITMPPPESKLILNAREKAMIVKWIEQGAKFKQHWAFIVPVKPDLPENQDPTWLVKNEIDLFIHERLQQVNLHPSAPAEKAILLKRVYMDLTGLPPDIEAIDAFLQDHRENALELIIDALLESEACAERLTLEWMDVARYADSHGLHADGWRNAWPWRDWVIKSFQQNMPYDQFVTEQLAGDLLPDPNKDQLLATAFHRNHPMTAEGGAIDEEFRLEYVADRTNTTATALMGLTMECARCHDHKFDPISQKEYYQMTAFFNNVHELGMTGDDGNYGPLLLLTSEETETKIKHLKSQIKEVNAVIEATEAEVSQLKQYLQEKPAINLNHGLLVHLPFEKKSTSEKNRTIFDGNRKVYTNGSTPLTEGIRGQAAYFNNEYDEIYLEGLKDLDVHTPGSVSMLINTQKKQATKTQVLIGNAGDKNNYWRGWDFYLEDDNRLSFRMIHSLPHNYFHIRTQDSIKLNSWTHVAFSYNGSGNAAGVKLYIGGKQVVADVVFDNLYKNIRTISSGANVEINRPLRISKSYRSFTGDNGIFIGLIDEIQLYNRILSGLEIQKIAETNVAEIHPDLLWDHAVVSASQIIQLQQKRAELVKEMIASLDTVSEVMIMEEMPTPRPTHVLSRGQYDSPLERVEPSTPESILAFNPSLPRNRLGLAQWLFDDRHPLTSRATVNRYWQMIFGRGIVQTARDFGNQGALPSHPELLDWLAIRLQEEGWNLKKLLKLMVMSATYQQSSQSFDRQIELDPENIYLARGASYRWQAELIRDNALAASGLLVRKVGGPSAKPYQPEGLWMEKGTFSYKLLDYIQDKGEGLYRRGLYTFIKRTSPHPVMSVFDVPSRDVCTITRETTNTPLQALVLLNDPQFVESGRILGERMKKEGGSTLENQITYGFRLITGRSPRRDELAILLQGYQNSLQKFTEIPTKAQELLSVGDFPRDEKLSLIESAAMAIVGSTLINLDEAYMKR